MKKKLVRLKNLLKNKYMFYIFLAVLLGFVLRVYNHDSFIHFELDQARDAIIVSEAIENGPGELPLLGPRAAGTMLRLGPFFYYQEYLSALIFGNTPAGMNGIGFFISLFTIVLFWFLFRLVFSKKISLGLVFVAASSLFLVTYSRFAWNPNMLPFFIGIYLLSFTVASIFIFKFNLKKLKKTKFEFLFKNKKVIAIASIYLCSISLTISTQLHFLAFVALPVITIAFALWVCFFGNLAIRIIKTKSLKKSFNEKVIKKIWSKRPTINISLKKHIIFAVLIFGFFYTPILINEFKTGFDNTKEFFKAVNKKSEKGDEHNFAEKLLKNTQEYSMGYFLLTTGIQKLDHVSVDVLRGDRVIDFKCNRACRDRLNFSILAFIFFSGGLMLYIIELRKIFSKHLENKNNILTKLQINFHILLLIMFFVTFFGFLSIAYKFPPRFLLFTSPFSLILLGLWAKYLVMFLKKKKKKNITGYLLFFFGILVVINIIFNIDRFKEQSIAHTDKATKVDRDIVLKENIRFTMTQQDLIVDWMLENSTKDVIYSWAPPKYYRPLVYLLTYQRGKDGRRLRYSAECLNADYFAVVGYTSDDDFFPKGSEIFKSVKSQRFGTMIVHKLKIKDDSLAEKKSCREEEKKESSYARRYNWNEIFE